MSSGFGPQRAQAVFREGGVETRRVVVAREANVGTPECVRALKSLCMEHLNARMGKSGTVDADADVDMFEEAMSDDEEAGAKGKKKRKRGQK
mmetsp:Transcript_8047/g.26740  ORF Transcript_8047/g.26740 Transcript_8047/m.26740 type:complete len:92 (-) Transcript_8047:297-572(-)